MKPKIIIIFGTRPEAIKLYPIIRELNIYCDKIETKICVTSQHQEMLKMMLDLFNITPDYDLNIMTYNQNLAELTSKVLKKINEIIIYEKPDFLIVQGDTTTAFGASLAGFYNKIPIAHVEAGLRTFNKYSPFPEEINRVLVSHIADLHFAPTEWAKNNLIKEGIKPDRIEVTGNTVIDTLKIITNEIAKNKISFPFGSQIDFNKKIILVTGHRRENFGNKLIQVFEAIKEIACKNKDVEIVYPIHLNPNVIVPANKFFLNIHNVKLIPPVDYCSFVMLMQKSYFIITDSGGVQEEAPYLGKPVLITRDITERPEVLEEGTAILVGPNKERIVSEAQRLLSEKDYYAKVSKITSPYGDGSASKKIIKRLLKEICR